MKNVLLILLLFATTAVWAGEKLEPMVPAKATVSGEVLEVINVENFVYLKLQTSSTVVWAAITNAKVKKGAAVTLENVIVMNDFESKSLKRTFDTILFGTLGSSKNWAASPSTLGAAFKVNPAR